MTHYGDIRQMRGGAIEPVDVIIGGSPCQDLSVSGKRAGLKGKNSVLFFEQIRIIQEMREATHGQQPRIAVWENVPGTLSITGKPKRDNFRRVLEEFARVAQRDTVIPRPPKKWTKSGCLLGGEWSIAWRVLDAQFWGVPQRRRRIALVVDFGGQCAPEILFEREGVSGDQ
jgi:DNA (cytosine-5)-methyltransferase 1